MLITTKGERRNAQKEMNEAKKTDVKKLTLSAVLIALSAGLSMIKVLEMPLGGSITPLSMLPVCMISIMYGCKWGLFCSFIYSLTQLGLGIAAVAGWGLTPEAFVGCIIFDYLIAFSVLGISGMFRKHGVPGYIAGIALGISLRMVSHVISGVVFFASSMPDGWNNPLLYSLAYNGAYMLPEFVLTFVGAVFLLKEPHTSKLFRVELPTGA